MVAVLILVVAAVFAGVVSQARSRKTAAEDRPFRVGRRALREAVQAPVRYSVPVRDFRWAPRPPNDQTDWGGRLFLTADAVCLRPSLKRVMIVGMPLAFPSYRVPVGRIAAVRRLASDQPPRLFQLMGSRPRPQVALDTDVGATCLVDFTDDAAADAAYDVLRSAVGH